MTGTGTERTTSTISRRALTRGAVLAALAWTAACSTDAPDPGADPGADASPGPAPSGSTRPSPSGSPAETPGVEVTSVPGFAAQTHHGDDLTIGAVRQHRDGWTSYDVTYSARSEGPGAYTTPVKVSGVLTLPDGDGPYPVAVLAHGYIDPAVYVSGQGMTRERKWLGTRGWASLHVDYRGHATSDDDPTHGADVRLGYTVDVIAGVDALRNSDDARITVIDTDRAVVFGRSMGGGVTQKVMEVAPAAFTAGVMWAAVSSLEAENVERFVGASEARTQAFSSLLATPEEDPAFWEGVSTRPYFDRISAPVLMIHGRSDDACPPRWATETHAAMLEAGVDVELEWYGEGHSFDADFDAAMDRTLTFLTAQ